MEKSQVCEFAKYYVYEMLEKETHYLAVFNELRLAKMYAIHLAQTDKSCDPYYIGVITGPTDWVCGGGWYIKCRMVDGEVKMTEVS